MGLRLSRTPVTAVLLSLITVVFALEFLSGALVDDRVLGALGAIHKGSIFAGGQYWRLLSGMFLHANFLHWLMNCWALYQLGGMFEVMFGSRRMAICYLATGLLASLVSAIRLAPGGISVGASGAIFGILGAFITSIRRSPRWRHEPSAKGLMSQLVFWALINIGLGLQIRFIDNAAHIGGLVSGLVIGFLMPHRVPPIAPGQVVVDVTPYDDGGSVEDPGRRTDDR